MKASAILFILFLFNNIASIAQPFVAPVIKAWGIERNMRGGAQPQPNQPSINRTTRHFFLETKPSVKITVTAVWIGETAFAAVEEPQTNSLDTDPTKPNTVLKVLVTDTLKAFKMQPSQLLGNEAVIVYEWNGKTFYVPIKTLQHIHINLP